MGSEETRMSELFEKLLLNPKSLLDDAASGDDLALAVLKSSLTKDSLMVPDERIDELLPELFRICIQRLDIDSLARASPSETMSEKKLGDVLKDPVSKALRSLQVLGTTRMRQSTLKNPGLYEPSLIEDWPRTFGHLQRMYGTLSSYSGDSSSRNIRGRSLLFSGALLTLLGNAKLLYRVQGDGELRKLAWELWIDGGLEAHKNEDDFNFGSAATILSLLYCNVEQFKFRDALLSNLTGLSSTRGGLKYVAEIALQSACHAMHSKLYLGDLRRHADVLYLLANDDGNGLVSRKIYELDGVPKLIEGVTYMAKNFRSQILDEPLATATGILIELISRLTSVSHKRIEQAASSGILQMLACFNEADISSRITFPIVCILTAAYHSFSSYSVVKAFSKKMRLMVEGGQRNEIGASNELSKPILINFKRFLVERYALMRLFDIISNVHEGVGYCTNCAKMGDRKSLLACATCKHTLYCSKRCQTEDWKLGQHKESCSKGSDGRYKNDIAFICFLANHFVRQEYNDLVKEVEFPVDEALFYTSVGLMRSDQRFDIGIKQIKQAEQDLQEKTSSSNLKKFRIIDQRSFVTSSPGLGSKPQTFIQVAGIESHGNDVILFVPLDFKSEPSAYAVDAVNPKHDLIAALIGKIEFREGSRESLIHEGEDSGVVSILDKIDEYVDRLSKSAT